MKKCMLFLLLFPSIIVYSQDCTELFFSEYVVGKGNNKALEIYNPTSQVVNLGQYWVSRFSNGSAAWDNGGATQLNGFILPYETFILVNGQTEDLDVGYISPKCDPALQTLAIEKNGMLDGDYASPTYMNGNDAIALWKDPVGSGDFNDFVPVDLFGSIADGTQDTDEGWTDFTQRWVYKNVYEGEVIVGKDSAFVRKYIVPDGYFWYCWTAGYSLFRKPEVLKGVTLNPDSFNVTLEWDTLPGGEDVWDDLGQHVCHCDPSVSNNDLKIDDQVYVWPNPVTNGIIHLYSSERIEKVELYAITGQQIRIEPPQLNNEKITIRFNDQPAGVYFLKLKSGGSLQTKKIIIQ